MSDCILCERAAEKLRELNEKRELANKEAEEIYAGAEGYWLVLTINRTGWQHRGKYEPTSHFPERIFVSLL